uniref:Uncharacterized protein n=1 Tax=Knipowitschia caucasica TaxID=637954 RepID=A0AAV2MT00_KNICA
MDGPNMMTCAICLEYFKDPSTIPCGHNFCLACINLHWDRQSKQGTSLDCPKCKQDFPSKPQLCRNMDLKELVEGVGSSGLYNAEVVAARADGGSDAPRDRPPCHRHGKPVVFFCNRDKMAVCCECVVKECAQHDKSMLEEERQNQEMILQKKEKDIERLIAETEKSLEDLSENIDQAKVNLQQTSSWVSTKFSSFIKSLVQKQEATERFMEEQSHSTMADAQSRHSQLEERVQRLQENQEQIQALRGLSDTQLIQESRFVKVPQFQDVSTEVNPGLQERLSAVTDVLTRVSKLLHEDLERAVGTALADRQGSPQDKRPILAVVPSPAAPFVPGLREGLDTYRCALTFDPCTANANLSLSHGNTRVEHLTSGPRLLPPDEARFDHTWQVMCSQGFQQGVHYWEMDVSKPWAFVGVRHIMVQSLFRFRK